MGKNLVLTFGENEIEQPLGAFHVEADRDESLMLITGTLLAPPDHAAQRADRSRSRVNSQSTVKMTVSTNDALDLAVHIVRAAKIGGIALPRYFAQLDCGET